MRKMIFGYLNLMRKVSWEKNSSVKMKFIIVATFIMTSLQAQQRSYFTNLVKIKNNFYDGLVEAYVLPSYTSAHKYQYDQIGEGESPLAFIRALPNQRHKILLIFGEGPSDDPYYYLVNLNTGKVIFNERADEIYIPGNGSIYVIGGFNRLGLRRKFHFNGQKFEEVKQDFYHIGDDTSLRKSITLYTHRNLRKKLAVLPKNYKVRIIGVTLNSEGFADKVLVKTSFGLVGWTKFNNNDYQIYYHLYMAD